MIRQKPSSICIASEKQVTFLMPSKDGGFKRHGNLPLETFVDGGEATDALPKAVRQAVNRLLVVPDYWVGNSFHEFPARKKSVITAFVERKLKLDQPTLTEADNFYSYAVVHDQDHRQLLYSTYLQEPVAYGLYRRMEALGITPPRMTTPALIWQAKLGEQIDGFSDRGIGFVHVTAGNCFLYFYYLGQFLFSRRIQIPDTGDDAGDVYNLLNYEINQSFYLYSQKTKSSVEALFVLAPDPEAAQQLSDLLGKEVKGLPQLLQDADLKDQTGNFPSACRGFSILDLTKHNQPAISYKPLQKELTWWPVQRTGIAVGLLLVVLLAFETGYLHFRSNAVARRMVQIESTAAEPPELVLGELSLVLDEITGELARPSGSGTVLRTLLAMPAAVSLKKLSLDASATRYLKIEAIIDADHPEAFKAILTAFLDRINDRFNLVQRPLKENDVTIRLERKDGDERNPLYLIHFGFEIT